MLDPANSSSSLDALIAQPRLDPAAIRAVQRRIAGYAIETPLVSSRMDPPHREVRLKLETLQPTGSFKIRGSANAILNRSEARLADGIWTASAGNFAQGLAWAARERGVAVRVHAPVTAASVKLEAIREYGAEVIVHSFEEWWRIVQQGAVAGEQGHFVHPFADLDVILGNATIGLEIVDSWPEVDTIVVPFGGGGLAIGVALAVKALRPNVRVVACESSAATPLSAAWAAGAPVRVPFDTSTFITGIGSTSVLPLVWPLLQRLIDTVVVVPVNEIERCVRTIARTHHVIAEGAGAAALAAALRSECGGARVVALISGGNIDAAMFSRLTTQPN